MLGLILQELLKIYGYLFLKEKKKERPNRTCFARFDCVELGTKAQICQLFLVEGPVQLLSG